MVSESARPRLFLAGKRLNNLLYKYRGPARHRTPSDDYRSCFPDNGRVQTPSDVFTGQKSFMHLFIAVCTHHAPLFNTLLVVYRYTWCQVTPTPSPSPNIARQSHNRGWDKNVYARYNPHGWRCMAYFYFYLHFHTHLLSSSWTSRAPRCRPFPPPVFAFNYRA